MREIIQSGRFRRDLKRMKKRGAELKKLTTIINLIATDKELPASTRPHKLSGNYAGFWECHIEPDWLLIYDMIETDTLALVATGSHSDLFR